MNILIFCLIVLVVAILAIYLVDILAGALGMDPKLTQLLKVLIIAIALVYIIYRGFG